MYGDAELTPGDYDVIIDEPAGQHALFSTPRLPVTDGDYLIGLQVSALIKDGGTLQIGIGTLGDAIAYGLDLRHNHNEVYTTLLRESGIAARYAPLIESTGGTAPFAQGLYGSTEMLVDGFLQLYKSGVIKRPVYRHAGIQSLLNQGRMTPQAIPARRAGDDAGRGDAAPLPHAQGVSGAAAHRRLQARAALRRRLHRQRTANGGSSTRPTCPMPTTCGASAANAWAAH